ncbi:FG-GAP-like repeat-containing protein [Conexibacter woesei]|uniref:FG-GAP-like repeat-containing protein n=1 Tax=Conexibacter woesei TaxID=191495 RepID=UPI0004255280|nr:FG-GAP-like repeat-containing protein [Conexibacter woesei]
MRSRTGPWRSAALAVGLVALATAAPAAHALTEGAEVDLASQFHTRIDGASVRIGRTVAGSQGGAAVAGAGDVNGDGVPDTIVGAPQGGPNTAGAAFVVFGPAAPGTVDLATLVADGRGIEIDAASAGGSALAGSSVAGAGDVNGDGYGDVIVGAPFAGATGRTTGEAYIIFGRPGAALVNLAQAGDDRIVLQGAAAGSRAGHAVAGIGDVNGDGLADVLVGAPQASRALPGHAYVVFGRASAQPVALGALGAGGVTIDGVAGDQAGFAVGAAADVDGDGRPDVVVGAPGAAPGGRTGAGSAYILLTRPGTTTVDLAALPAGDVRIDGAAADDGAGRSVAGAGDVDGDGHADVLVGAPFADPDVRGSAGAAYVVRGGGAGGGAVALGDAGAVLTRIDGAVAGDEAGAAVAGPGDVNGDGVPDVLAGAPGADPGGRSGAGAAYVVLGAGRQARTVDLASDLGRVVPLDGGAASDSAGRSVGGAGDVTGDGLPDVLVGAPGADRPDIRDAGAAYVLAARPADLAVSVAASPAQAAVGDPVEVSVAAVNNGPDDAPGAQLVVTLEPGFTVDSYDISQGTCTQVGRQLRCALGTLRAGGGALLLLRGTVGAGTTGTLAEATATSAFAPDVVTANDRAAAVVAVSGGSGPEPAPSPAPAPAPAPAPSPGTPPSRLVVTKRVVQDAAFVGEPLDYDVTIRNDGGQRSEAIRLTDLFSALVHVVAVAGDGARCTTGRPIACALPALAPGASATLHVRVVPQRGGRLANVAGVLGSGAATAAAPSNATAAITVGPRRARLALALRGPSGRIRPGARVAFHATVAAGQAVNARALVLCARLPDGWRPLPGGGVRVRAGRPCWATAQLLAGRARRLTIAARVPRGYGGGRYTTRATAVAANAPAARARASSRVAEVPHPCASSARAGGPVAHAAC